MCNHDWKYGRVADSGTGLMGVRARKCRICEVVEKDIPDLKTCDFCNGSKVDALFGMSCPKCDGAGKVYSYYPEGPTNPMNPPEGFW